MQRLMLLFEIPYAGKSIAASSIVGRHHLIKKVLRQGSPNVNIGLETMANVSLSWLENYLFIKPDKYVTGHAAYSVGLWSILQEKRYKAIQVIRHPAAILSSWANYIVEPGYYWNDAHNFLSSISKYERLKFLILGGTIKDSSYFGLRNIFEKANGWFANPEVLTIRFEDLVGAKGGGDDERQFDTIIKISRHIGLENIKDDAIKHIQANLFGHTSTFRNGTIDAWRENIDDDLVQLLKSQLAGLGCIFDLNYDL